MYSKIKIMTAREFIKKYFNKYIGIEVLNKGYFKNNVSTSIINYSPSNDMANKNFVVLNYRTHKHRTRLFVLCLEELKDPGLFKKYSVLRRSNLEGLYINTSEKIELFLDAKSFDANEVLRNMYLFGSIPSILDSIKIDEEEKKDEAVVSNPTPVTNDDILNSILKNTVTVTKVGDTK